jgi:toxin ParE1/3/4
VTRLLIAPAALKDLEAIWSYTLKTWSIEQADSYVATIYRDMARLIDFPHSGPAHPTKVGKFRKLASGHHLIFYAVLDHSIQVVRILHERMDVERRLGG